MFWINIILVIQTETLNSVCKVFKATKMSAMICHHEEKYMQPRTRNIVRISQRLEFTTFKAWARIKWALNISLIALFKASAEREFVLSKYATANDNANKELHGDTKCAGFALNARWRRFTFRLLSRQVSLHSRFNKTQCMRNHADDAVFRTHNTGGRAYWDCHSISWGLTFFD